jgi:hypothetical protein
LIHRRLPSWICPGMITRHGRATSERDPFLSSAPAAVRHFANFGPALCNHSLLHAHPRGVSSEASIALELGSAVSVSKRRVLL